MSAKGYRSLIKVEETHEEPFYALAANGSLDGKDEHALLSLALLHCPVFIVRAVSVERFFHDE